MYVFCVLHLLHIVFCIIPGDRLASYVFCMSSTAAVCTTLATRFVLFLPLAGTVPLLFAFAHPLDKYRLEHCNVTSATDVEPGTSCVNFRKEQETSMFKYSTCL